jgi:hypothetical protein
MSTFGPFIFTIGVDWEGPRACQVGAGAGLDVIVKSNDVNSDHSVGT